MNKRRQIGILLVMFCCILCSCTKVTKETVANETRKEAAEQPVSETVQQSEVEETAENQPDNLGDAIEQILDDANREFIGGYLLDESFFLWLSGTYGEECVYKLADAVEEETQDCEQWYAITGKSIHVLWLEYCECTGFQSYMLEKVYQKECAEPNQVVLDFTGDINLCEDWPTTEYMDEQPNGIEDCMSQALLTEMRSADILMINNEYTYSTGGEPLAGKTYTFRANPRRVSVLGTLGTDIVSVANNHVYDYGPTALVDTLETLEQAGMPYVGAGRNLEEAMQPVSFIANGRKITIVAATQIERSTNYTKEATADSPGVLKTLNPDKFLSVIEKARKNSDYVIAFVHWGTEGTNQYGSDQVSLGQQFIDAGADVIIGGHTHCLQGFDYYKGKPIIYSLGNFWFNDKKLDTGLSQVIIHTDSNAIDFRFLPCIQQDCVTSLVEETGEKQRILDFMQEISAPGVQVNSEGYVSEE